MRRRTRLLVIAPLVALALAYAGCGDDSSGDSAATTSAETTTSTETVAAASEVPADLLGSYAMTLKPSDVPPDPPPELTDQAEHWTLEISSDGAPGGGPGFTIVNDALGTLESSPLTVDGDHLTLHDEECATSPDLVESEYTWALEGDSLTFEVVRNGCDDEVVLTLLTAEPWVKQS